MSPTNKSSVRRRGVLLEIDTQIVEFLGALLVAASFELLRRPFDGEGASAEDNPDDHGIHAKYLGGRGRKSIIEGGIVVGERVVGERVVGAGECREPAGPYTGP